MSEEQKNKRIPSHINIKKTRADPLKYTTSYL